MIVDSGISAAIAAVMTAKPAEPPAQGPCMPGCLNIHHSRGCVRKDPAPPQDAEPQSEPPIDFEQAYQWAASWRAEPAMDGGLNYAPNYIRNAGLAYLSLKAERDALRAENAAKYEEIASERHSYILLEAERQRLYDGNAALKARVEELEQIMVLHFITHDDDHQPEGEQGEQKAQDFRDECGRIIHRQAADARKEQEASNGK